MCVCGGFLNWIETVFRGRSVNIASAQAHCYTVRNINTLYYYIIQAPHNIIVRGARARDETTIFRRYVVVTRYPVVKAAARVLFKRNQRVLNTQNCSNNTLHECIDIILDV